MFDRTAAAAFLLLLFIPLAFTRVYAQGQIDRNHEPSKERVSVFERLKGDIDGNNLRATIFNTGLTGRTGAVPGEIPYEWPKNTRRHYIALTGLFVGAEVIGENGQPTWLVDLPRFRNNPNQENVSWSFEPIPGYANTSIESKTIARSDDPNTWPNCWPDKMDDPIDAGWCGSWNGFFGKDVFNADQELYYKMGDDTYGRHPYYPDTTDLTRRGLGLIVETRVLAWSQVLINDVLFVIHNVKNDGTKDLDKVGVTLWLADLVGGDGDSSDDMPFYDLLEDVAFMTDLDGIGNPQFQNTPVGAAAAVFLETPGNAVDRIDNDGDGTTGDDVTVAVGEPGSPVITAEMLEGENPTNGIDDNGNGLIDENETHVPFAAGPGQIAQKGVGYADYIDNDGDGEANSPVVTQEMISAAAGDRWHRWPPNPNLAAGERVHLIGVGTEDLGAGFKDGVDNDNSCDNPGLILSEPGSPKVTQEMIDAARNDPYGRYRVPGTSVVLYQLGPEDLGKCYADGIDNDGDGAIDEGIDENIDEMIDESRADGIDNDGDWRPGLDDVGLDGADFTSDFGEGDGRPTSGAGTDFPGEPNIDVTDVSESDQIGITNVQYDPAGGIDYQRISDKELFNRFMIPGQFFDPSVLEQGGDFDLFVSSGIFPLRAGQTERISYAVILGEDNRSAAAFQDRFRDILTKRNNAVNAYQADYRFAQAPLTPTVTAVPGDGKVTLYWDSKAEDTFDNFMADIGFPARDFEGYRVYRATDPAFLDAKVITDGFGNAQFLRPLAQFDLINGNQGFHPVAINGTQFYLGNDMQDPGEAGNGLAHVFVDSTVTNGVRYFYAVTSYDFGAAAANIAPSESPIRIRFEADGTITTGPNVVEVTPTSSPSGVIGATLDDGGQGFLPRVQGNTTSRIGYEIVDPTQIRDGHQYRIIFEDTLIVSTSSTAADTLTTKNFSLIDVTDGRTVINRSQAFRAGQEAAVVDGFRLKFFADPFIVLDRANTSWKDTQAYPIVLEPYVAPPRIRGFRNPQDYRVVVGEDGSGHSIELNVGSSTLPARPTNFRVINAITGEEVDYGFADRDNSDGGVSATSPARLTADPSGERSDFIILYERMPNGEMGITWRISLDFTHTDKQNPAAGNEALIVTKKPFLSWDVFEFTAKGPTVDEALAAEQLDQIRVVPNPYRGASLFEGTNPYSTGRGEREIRFIHLPPRCTIRIYTVSGHLVQVLEHNMGSNENLTADALLNGEVAWNLESRDNLSVSYGVYVYHVDAPGIGEKTGTFAIIK